MMKTIIFLLAVLATTIATPIVSDRVDGRLQGGVAVNLGQVPFMASLRSLTAVHFCGGSIVSQRYVLTSAQCTVGRPVNGVQVVIGTVTLNAGGTIHVSSNITLHPSFDRETLANDLSLVFTATLMALTVNVQTVAVSANIFGGDVTAQVSGWGSNTIGGGQPPNNLQRLTSITITNADCRARHNPQNAARITDNKICTLTRSTEGTCYGDEGGGLIAGGQLIGVVSWQVPCATGVPDVFERIASHRLWIMSII